MADQKPSSPGTENHRYWDRLQHHTEMDLVLNDGRCFAGTSHDISLGGVFLQVAQPDLKSHVGRYGHLELHTGEGDLSFPCLVVRATDAGLGVKFIDKNAGFGMYMSHFLMLDLLSGINNLFAGALDIDETLNIAVEHIKDYMQSEGASLFLVEAGGRIRCRSCSGPVDITGVILEPGEGIVGRSIAEGQVLVVGNVDIDPHFASKVDKATGFKTDSILCAPLKIKGEVLGALEVVNKRGCGLFAGHDRMVLSALASATAMAIHIARQANMLLEAEANTQNDLRERVNEATRELVAAKEAAEQANRKKSDFLSSMSHELRTPLNAILGFGQIMDMDAEHPLSDDQRTSLEQIMNGGRHLLGLINEILDLAKIEAGRIDLSIEKCDIGLIALESLSYLETLADQNGIVLHFDHALAASADAVKADPVRFKQVLLNLLSNAVKYNRENGTVTLAWEATDNGSIRIRVTDTGHGIAPDKLASLFEPFNRLDAEKSKIEGTGLGLSITRQLIERMDGRIGVDSTPGEGTTFWIELPRAD
ncbi:MAG: GAF domain-containing protein [Alphaproteobacteria bacterium]|nr:GAF domain-containing protein [Alphaproteobacteria bacterium]